MEWDTEAPDGEEFGPYGDVIGRERRHKAHLVRYNSTPNRSATYIDRCQCGTGYKPLGMYRCFNCRPEGLELWEGVPKWLKS